MTSSSKLWEPFVWWDQTDNQKNIFISYYYIEPNDPKRKLWIRSPFDTDFIAIDPYTQHDFISKHITTDKGVQLFKTSWLRKTSYTRVGNNKLVLIALLWLKHDISYENQIIGRQHEFYNCMTTNLANNSYILIPLYAKSGYTHRKNPVLIYHSGSIRNTLMIAMPEIYDNLLDMFGRFINPSQVIMNDEKRFLIQFNEYPACFLS